MNEEESQKEAETLQETQPEDVSSSAPNQSRPLDLTNHLLVSAANNAAGKGNPRPGSLLNN